MRIVTWNMNAAFRGEGHPAGWDWLAETLRPDLVLAQEAIKPDHLAGHGALIGAAGSSYGWGAWIAAPSDSVDVEPGVDSTFWRLIGGAVCAGRAAVAAT